MLVLALAACTPKAEAAINPDDGKTPENEVNLVETKWSLVSFGDVGTEVPLIEDTAITIEFDDEGQAGGSGGCNSYGMQYKILGDEISFSEITSTLMACEFENLGEQEQRFFKALETAGRLEIKGDNLTIWYNGGQGVLNWQKES